MATRMLYTYSEETGDDVAVLALTGELDCTATAMLDERLLALAEQPSRRLVLDIRAVTFIDSTAIAAVMRAAGRLAAQNRRLTVICEHPNVLRVLEIVGLDRSCPLHRSREETGLPDRVVSGASWSDRDVVPRRAPYLPVGNSEATG